MHEVWFSLGLALTWSGLARLGGVTREEEVTRAQKEVQPVVQETGRTGMDWPGLEHFLGQSFVWFHLVWCAACF